MPKEETATNISKAAKLEKLRLAREKAKRWALEQKQKQTPQKSVTSAMVPKSKPAMIATPIEEEEEEVVEKVVSTRTKSKIPTEKKKRKRGREESDESESEGTGPYGTPKVKRPSKKISKTIKTESSKTDVKYDYNSSTDSEENSDLDISQKENIIMQKKPTSTTTKAAKAPSSKVDKREKLRLAREKAAKWAKAQKYGAAAPESTKSVAKKSRSSVGTTSTGGIPADTKSQRKRTDLKLPKMDSQEEVTMMDIDQEAVPRRPTPANVSPTSAPITPAFIQPAPVLAPPPVPAHVTAPTPMPVTVPVSSAQAAPPKLSYNSAAVTTPALFNPVPTPQISAPPSAPVAPVHVPPAFVQLVTAPALTAKPIPTSAPSFVPTPMTVQPKPQPLQQSQVQPPSQPSQIQKVSQPEAISIAPTTSLNSEKWKEAILTIKQGINKAAADAIEVVDQQERTNLSVSTPIPQLSSMTVPSVPNGESLQKEATLEQVIAENKDFLQQMRNKKYAEVDSVHSTNDKATQMVMQDAVQENKVMFEHNEQMTQRMFSNGPEKVDIELKQETAQDTPPMPVVEENVENKSSLFSKMKWYLECIIHILCIFIMFGVGVGLVYVAIDQTSPFWGHLLNAENDSSISSFLPSISSIFYFKDVGLPSEKSEVEQELESKSTAPRVFEIVAPPCFTSTIETSDQEHMDVPESLQSSGISSCHMESGELLPCPHGGICFGGYLQTCFPGDILELSEGHNICTLTKQGETILAKVKNRLIDMTLERTCGCWLSGWLNENKRCLVKESDMMEMDAVDGEDGLPMPMLFKVMSLCDSLDISQQHFAAMSPYWIENDILYQQSPISSKPSSVGLTASFLHSKLPMPMTCYMSLFLEGLFGFLCSTLISVLSSGAFFFLHCLVSYPIPTVIGMFLMFVVHAIRTRRKRTQALRKETRDIREKAYEKLKLRSDRYGEQHLRDDIAHELYPDSLMLRKKFMSEIWPRVLVEVRCDSRIKRGFSAGMEWWEWADRGAAVVQNSDISLMEKKEL